MKTTRVRALVVIAGVLAAAVAGLHACAAAAEQRRPSDVVSGTGGIAASEIAGQPKHSNPGMTHLEAPSLDAERTEAYARYKQSLFLAASADAAVLLRESQTRAAEAVAKQYESEFQATVQRLSSTGEGALPAEELEQLRADARRGAAVAAAADAQVAAARVAVVVARLDAESAHAGVEAAKATVRRIEITAADATLACLISK